MILPEERALSREGDLQDVRRRSGYRPRDCQADLTLFIRKYISLTA
jgi:hypothetical protein